MRWRTRWSNLAGAAAALVVATSCGVPVDGAPTAFEPEQPTQVAATPTPEPAETGLFPIYLVDGNNRMQRALREVPSPPTITALINELIEEPTEQERERNLVSLLPEETAFFAPPFIDQETRTAELDFLSGTSLDTLADEALVAALAQLVWTLNESPSIDRVIIKLDGQPQSWPTDQEASTSGAPLTFADYDEFSPDFVEPTPTPDPANPTTEPPSEGETPTPGG